MTYFHKDTSTALQLSFAMLRMTRSYLSRLSKISAEYHLSGDQVLILHALAQAKDPIQISDLTRLVPVQQPAVTKAVQSFEAKGWVNHIENHNNHRSKYIALTPDGLRFIGEVQSRIAHNFMPFFQVLTGEQQQNLSHATDVLTKAFSKAS